MDKIKKKKRKIYTGITRRGHNSFLISYYDGLGNRTRETIYAKSEKEAYNIRELKRLGVEQKVSSTPRIEFHTYINNFIQELINDNRPKSSVRKYKERYERLLGYVNQEYPHVKYLSDITAEHIRTYKKYRCGEGYSNNGINNELTIIRRLFNKAIEGGILRVNPAREVEFLPENAIDRDFFREHEMKKIIKTLGKNKHTPYYHFRYMYQFLYYVPWRKMEMASLKKNDYDPKDKLLKHHIWKTKDIRCIKLTDRVAGILDKQLAYLKHKNINSDYMFPTRTGKQMHRNHILEWFKKAVKDAGIEKPATVHMLRRSFVSNAHSKGYSLEQISNMTGHKDIDTLRKHYMVIPKDIQMEIQDKLFIGKQE